MAEAPFLLARLHLPNDHPSAVLSRPFGGHLGPMDGDIAVFSRAGEEVRAYTQWTTVEPDGVARGEIGLVRLMPLHPPLWRPLQAGQTLHLHFARLSLQLTQPLTEFPV